MPLLGASSSPILLAASSLEPGQPNANPLAAILLASPPTPRRRLDVNLDDQLQVLGFDTQDERGRAVDALVPGRTYHLVTYYRVLARVTSEWLAFHSHRRKGSPPQRRRPQADERPLPDVALASRRRAGR